MSVRSEKKVVGEIDEIKKLRQAFNRVLKTEEGRVVWGYLHRALGWDRPTIRISRATGDLAPLSTEAAAALRDTYLQMRHIPDRDLVAAAEEIAETQAAPAAAAAPSKTEERK